MSKSNDRVQECYTMACNRKSVRGYVFCAQCMLAVSHGISLWRDDRWSVIGKALEEVRQRRMAHDRECSAILREAENKMLEQAGLVKFE